MKLSIETASYNDRRYSKPWIAKVDFADPKGVFAFGDWIGERGQAGLLEIDAEPGDIIASGQKDFRQPRNSAPVWNIVESDGSLRILDGKVTAVKLFRELQNNKATNTE